MTLALTLVIVGLVIGFGAFGFAAVNMYRGVTTFSPVGMFKKHIGAMIAMAMGGLTFAIGLVLAIVHALNHS